LTIHGVNDIKHTEFHIPEPLVLETNRFEVEITNENLKRYESPGIDQISLELVQTVGNALLSKIRKLMNYILSKE
jgi:hypothetical protein